MRHWILELMNLLAGNSRYVSYSSRQQAVFALILLFVLITPALLYWLL
ncbi:hypothetical protein [Spirosoma endbachense]|uniref:Uncharacterized protein n=1 Tax=Spirosoma endbachense TaxID=2666025 RepID=A0A6P1VP46_9BACT|nr:hypothetical protein [Spirosoma endbachense]QHV95031.1 hypothetical protein GJR95_08340 [Spirosoma endbachense]